MTRSPDLPESCDADVLVVGGGPVGLLVAADLDSRGVSTIVVEDRPFLEPPNVKCNHVSARTMEAFRRLGLADAVRSVGLPAEHPQDVAFRTSATGVEFGRIPIPSAAARRRGDGVGPDTTWATPEPPHRVNQRYLEPVLEQHVATLPHVDLRNDTRCTTVSQDDRGVTATLRGTRDGAEVSVRARYLVGADGGRSLVRRSIGARLHGDPVLQHVQSTCVRVPGLADRVDADPAWGVYVFNPRRQGHIYAIDGRDVFLVHSYLTPEEAAHDSVDRDRAVRDILGVGDAVAYEVLSKEDWVARRLVADTFRDRRVFLAGDAAHLWVPYGGYGMNAGIADGLNLAWLLGAVLSGWADESVLDAYAAERQPITDQVSRLAMGHLRKIDATDLPTDLEADTQAGATARRRLGELAYDLNVQQFAAAGLNFGYSYGSSPIIVPDGDAPDYTMGTYTPSTVPGCRLPHTWLADGVSLYDRLGPWYTLVVSGRAAAQDTDLDAWAATARAAGLPVEVLVVPDHVVPDPYVTRYLIARQDQHVAWRGDDLPDDPTALAAALGSARARGATGIAA
ncbi:FAD-dependent monooxygenase [Isoptericola sp. NPDC057391]|uniref:FAD-dependent monooxygenase n=1 Tax=Isoptericola sp. NPDC057391 TaxID=3346117 RepID=UPI00362C4CD9